MTLSSTILTLFAAATPPTATAVPSALVTAPPAYSAAAPSRVESIRALVAGLADNENDLVSALRETIAAPRRR
jgi:hypothetical protein